MTPASNLMMVGLPDSGKSTYLAAVFHVVKEDPKAILSLRELPEARDYLIELERKWLDLEPVGHSAQHGIPQEIQLPLTHPALGDIDLMLPDVSGEDFRDAWEHGDWPERVAQLVDSSTGFLVFVRADDIDPPELIEVGSEPREKSEGDPWHARVAPTQAKVCDILEQLVEMRNGDLPRVAVIISAWDTVEPNGPSPDEWLAWKLPLLSQWLQATEPRIDWKAFAVSAQGGDIRDAKTRSRLSRMSRIERTGGAQQLTAALLWLLE